MKNRLSILVAAVLFLFAVSAHAADTIKIGVLAKDGPAKALKAWSATGEYLTTTMGKKVEIVPLDFDKVNPAIEGNEVDFFLINSSMYVTAKVKYGANAIATMINSRQGQALDSFGGVIIASAYNDSINSLADLKGKTFMAVKQSSFGGWQMAYKTFKDEGIDPFKDFAKLEFSGKHDNVVFAIQNETAQAGTVRTDTLERMAAAGAIAMADFKIINKQNYPNFPFVCSTTLYPEWPLAKTAATSDALAQELVAALKQIKKDDPAATKAKIIGWTDPLDYTPVEELQKALSIGAFKN
ncbi:MAG: PhnD/SsuA/transferrin family substrate-binding protein [Proteobacteria bacterium]|nr:PhnD/SsuA/transferrin family substrate-binding protein [Pseudomonadota bacterium]MBU1420315.1 PhnD/SsuA/transferrin family substrate-binding protein [Pseudomonadota bacterium]MBU1453469.1 PhnD/SsuA/transferrin family substrate-binding protein [Pseudomonadota bacterium]